MTLITRSLITLLIHERYFAKWVLTSTLEDAAAHENVRSTSGQSSGHDSSADTRAPRDDLQALRGPRWDQEEVRQLRNEMLEDKKKHEDDKKKDEEEIGNMKLEMDDLRETLLAATSKVSNFELGYKNDQLKAKLATFESKPLIYILCLYYTYSSKLVLHGLTDWSENPIYLSCNKATTTSAIQGI